MKKQNTLTALALALILASPTTGYALSAKEERIVRLRVEERKAGIALDNILEDTEERKHNTDRWSKKFEDAAKALVTAKKMRELNPKNELSPEDKTMISLEVKFIVARDDLAKAQWLHNNIGDLEGFKIAANDFATLKKRLEKKLPEGELSPEDENIIRLDVDFIVAENELNKTLFHSKSLSIFYSTKENQEKFDANILLVERLRRIIELAQERASGQGELNLGVLSDATSNNEQPSSPTPTVSTTKTRTSE